MTTPLYAIGDIHGQLAMLEDALARIERDGGSDAEVVFLGDYVDRGPDSRGVIELLMQGIAQGRNWTMLKGNHDRMMSYWLDDLRPDPQLLIGYHWLHDNIGGVQTLASYGVEVPERARHYQVLPQARAAVPQAHRAFLDGLKPCHQVGELLFVHAGIRPGIPLADQTEDDLCWIRQEFLIEAARHPWLVVHGHTPERQPVHAGNRVNLDSGAGYGRPLTAAVFEDGAVWTLGAEGRVPLRPGPR